MSMNWGECYYDHYLAFLREPASTVIFRGDNSENFIQILSFDNVFKGCKVLCSLGLTHFASELDNVCEIFMPVDSDWESAENALANALFYMVKNHMTIHRGSCLSGIENIDPSFASQYHKTSLYLTLPYNIPDAFQHVKCGDQIGSVYLAFFISQSERDFIVKNGPTKFEDLLEQRGVDPFKLERLPSV